MRRKLIRSTVGVLLSIIVRITIQTTDMAHCMWQNWSNKDATAFHVYRSTYGKTTSRCDTYHTTKLKLDSPFCIDTTRGDMLKVNTSALDVTGCIGSSEGRESSITDEFRDRPLWHKFGIDLGPMEGDIHKWLWPEVNKNSVKRNTSKSKFIEGGGYLPPSLPNYTFLGRSNLGNQGKTKDKLHEYILHNYGQEKIVDIFRRIAFYMRISPRILCREVAGITGKFGINILQPQDCDNNANIRRDVACLRRIKFKIYSLLGLKLMKYHLLLLLRYIRLGIPPEIRDRYIADILTRRNIANACRMLCSGRDSGVNYSLTEDSLAPKQYYPSQLTYPDRLDFSTQGFPYSNDSFYHEQGEGWSPAELVLPRILESLSEGAMCKLVYVASALKPQYCLQIIKNVAFCAGYKSEKELIQKFCLTSKFGSRGANAFVSRLREEVISNAYINRAAALANGVSDTNAVDEPEKVLSKVPIVAGLMKRHMESGHRVMPIRTSRMIFKRIRNNSILRPSDITLWDILRGTIMRRVPNTPLYLYKQVRMELFDATTYTSPYLEKALRNRGVDTKGLYGTLQDDMNNSDSMEYRERRALAKEIRKNLRNVWLENSNHIKQDMERIGLDIIDAMAAAAGYRNINHILVLVGMLSTKCRTIQSWRTQQPGPDFEHSNSLTLRDFRYIDTQA